jgi:exonuclease VII small subunit
VEEETIPAQFRRLEDRVGQLVRRCSELERGKADLETKIKEYQQALEAKDAAEQTYREEKRVIRSRIDDLLGRLNEVLGSS